MDQDVVPCQWCDKTFKTEGYLSRHLKKCAFITKPKIARTQHVDVSEERNALTSGEEELPHLMNANETEGDDNRLELEDISEIPPPPVSPLRTKSGRNRMFPKRYKDFVPTLPTPFPHMPPALPDPLPVAAIPTPSTPLFNTVRTQPNEFGLYREYSILPQRDPEEEREMNDLCDIPGISPTANDKQQKKSFMSFLKQNLVLPFLNRSSQLLLQWFYNGSSTKSINDLNDLINTVLVAEDFNPRELEGFETAQQLRNLDDYLDQPVFDMEEGWKQSSVKIKLPATGVAYTSEADAPTFEVPGIHHRSLLDTISQAFREPIAKTFHYAPHKLFWLKHPDSAPERIVSEIYNSDVFLEEDRKLQLQPHEPGCKLERAVASILVWSDSTHLANFGTASLWPLYLFLGNQSKYDRCQPKRFAAHHVAYLPSLPDNLADYYKQVYDMAPDSDITGHLKRELMHEIWLLLMDEDFMYAYEHGIVIECADGIWRRLYPRFFTYGADYPEKVLIATLKFLGACPCPRCLVTKKEIQELGTVADKARRKKVRVDNKTRQDNVEWAIKRIYTEGIKVNSTAFDARLTKTALNPTRNAFSTRLSSFGFNFHRMLVPDLLHEFEIGVWRAIFTHLIRLVDTLGGSRIQILNQRYRRMSTFGRDTIRRFSNNTSEMKKLAARDFEDILQCSMPAFEGLFPDSIDDNLIQQLLFTLCTWHSLAKLRMHSETTLEILDYTTENLGRLIRKFRDTTCSKFVTRELQREKQARERRAASNKKKKDKKAEEPPGPRLRMFNMTTYKMHALGDYVQAIRMFGTTDNYSTQLGELEHKRVKRFYARTNKNRTFQHQISKHQRRERLLHMLREKRAEDSDQHGRRATVPFETDEPLTYSSPTDRYHISHSCRQKLDIGEWLLSNKGDMAVKDFYTLLKDHLLGRLLGMPYSGDENDFTDKDRDTVVIQHGRLYKHKVLRVNYTTYDMRRMQDSLNPRTDHRDVIVLSHEEDSGDAEIHPYWYARIIGIFHVNAYHVGPRSSHQKPIKMDFLWIRWFGRDTTEVTGWRPCQLHRIGFLDSAQPGAFGFLDPKEIIRGVHIIPGYAHGTRTDLLDAGSIARQVGESKEDWVFHYVNMFSDRDMTMRFLGGGIGHNGILGVNFPGVLPEDFHVEESEDDVDNDEVVFHDDIQDDKTVDNEEGDYGYIEKAEDMVGDNAEEREGGDVDLGAEDGEELDDDDEMEGYAQF